MVGVNNKHKAKKEKYLDLPEIKKKITRSSKGNYIQESSDIELKFIKLIEKCPKNTDETQIFPFDRINSRYLFNEFHADKFGGSVSKIDLNELFSELGNANEFDYLKLFRRYNKFVLPVQLSPFLIAMIISIIITRYVKSAAGAVCLVFFLYCLFAAISVILLYFLFKKFNDELVLRSDGIQNILSKETQKFNRKNIYFTLGEKGASQKRKNKCRNDNKTRKGPQVPR